MFSVIDGVLGKTSIFFVAVLLPRLQKQCEFSFDGLIDFKSVIGYLIDVLVHSDGYWLLARNKERNKEY